MKAIERTKQIFLEALEKDTGSAREAYLGEVCRDDPSLRAEIDALLRVHGGGGGFLQGPILGPPDALADLPISEGPGTVIDRYKLLEKIGEGGMAVVYMAEQEQPIRRKVALKIIKLGMDTCQVIARFEAERQALALMDHPSIAKVLDAGATETGRPYFVMELVQGVSITEYCDKNRLSTKDRLALFLHVCQAVQHAHQKGIIHRDIKPSNVMVTHHDGKPVPKVIDFGIAKATNQKLTERTLFTRYAHLIGTPAYMSPEQAELNDLDIDTRSDIYSLGVLLYELLTGTTPFSEEELRKAGYVEMQRVIREQEPVKPSTRIRTSEVAQPPSAGITPEGGGATVVRGTPYQQVRGDLDWIVMKALEKDRVRRYETASGLAEDVRRHLAHEPILARGPSTAYRLRKFLRRHRWQTIAALAVIVIAGAAVVVLSLWSRDRLRLLETEGFQHRAILSQAREQYAKAEREAALETIKPILDSRHAGPEAQLLRAGILADNRRMDEAVALLNKLLNEPPAIGGAAHALLARILWERESPNAERLKEIEEHRRRAEALLPETAEAYFLRAMTALTIKEQLVALDRALQLDPTHYESQRLRAFTYYASRKYDRLRDDALAMTILRPRDPLGSSLRATAWRELGKYGEAIAEYDRALALTAKGSPEHADLCVQRSAILLRMGDYERVISHAPVEAQDPTGVAGILPAIRGRDALESQNLGALRYHVFSALTALGNYDKAAALFRQIIAPGHEARRKFQDWCARYVFDTLEAGRSWHPLDREPAGAAFLPMMEAEETYRDLSAKSRRVTTDGFSASWSPDGKKLAFSLGVQGYSGVAVLDSATKETDLLIVPGKDPRWSPDGKYIAFVRDCQLLRVSELIAAERRDQPRVFANEEVWVMRCDGTEPRRLGRGGWPSWSQDSTCIYYQSRRDGALYSVSITEQETEPKKIMACSYLYPSISPDSRHVAYVESASLKITDLASQALVAERPAPFGAWGGAGWSANGRELCLAGRNDSDDRTGLWVYNLDRAEPARTLRGQITLGAWARDGTKLLFCLGPPYFEVWATDLDPDAPTNRALGAGQTADEHFCELIAFYTRRIQADPQDAYAYSSRARYHDCLHNRTKASADMREFFAIVNHGAPQSLRVATPRRLCGALNGPFGYQLAFCVGGRDKGIPLLSVAFGQKGRCDMKVFEIPMLMMSLFGFGLFSTFDTLPAHAGFTFGEPRNLGPIVNGGSSDCGSCLSSDGLSLYYTRYAGGYGSGDTWVTTRATLDGDWRPPENLGPLVNTSGDEYHPAISTDELELYFGRGSRASGTYDLWVAKRARKSDTWGRAENLGLPVNMPGDQLSPCISVDGLELCFVSGRWSPDYDQSELRLFVAKREMREAPWGQPVTLGSAVNNWPSQLGVRISHDGLLLLLADFWNSSVRPGGLGDTDIWLCRRATKDADWGPPLNLGRPINTEFGDRGAMISPDGSTIYFDCYNRHGGFGSLDIWQAPIIPIVDFNADMKVDLVDLVMLINDWGKSTSVCDIGPMPWGDGKVDIEDLKVFMTYYEKENPPVKP